MQTLRQLLAINPMAIFLPLIIFAVTLVVGWLIRQLFMRALRTWGARSASRPALILAEALRGGTMIWIVILAAHLAIQTSELPVKYANWSSRGLLVLWVISFTMISMRLAGNLVHYYGGQVPGALPVTTLTQNLAQLAVLILGIVILLRSLGLEIAPILTALGVGGLAVALALQDTLSNLFAGFYVAVAGQIRLGDYIKLNTGEEGYVTDIGWRATTIRALAHNMIIIPNAKLSQAIVTNYYLPEKRMGASVQVTVSYEEDPDRVERVLLEIVRKGVGEIPGMVGDPPPSVEFDPGFVDSGMGFKVNYQVAEFAGQFPVRNEVRRRILRRFREQGIRIPYPARRVFMENGHSDSVSAGNG
jgi:small-conductance mechanosensitive channel